jgi:hypothetical protein
MATIAPIRITGLREIQAALRQLDGESQKQLRVVLNSAAQAVVGGASRRVPTKTGAARQSIRAASGQREAKVSGGSKKVPYYGWLDFGGKVGRARSVSRPFLQSGRYIYPAYDANKDSIGKALSQALVDLCRNVGLEVTASG